MMVFRIFQSREDHDFISCLSLKDYIKYLNKIKGYEKIVEKMGDKILLEEAKAGYARQLANWNELGHSFQNFFRSNGLLLTTIFIGIGFIGMNSTPAFIEKNPMLADVAFILLLSSVITIAISSFCAIPSIRDLRAINKINEKLNDGSYLKNNESEIISSLIEKYDVARREIVAKYNKMLTDYDRLIISFYVGLMLLVFFIIIILYLFISV